MKKIISLVLSFVSVCVILPFSAHGSKASFALTTGDIVQSDVLQPLIALTENDWGLQVFAGRILASVDALLNESYSSAFLAIALLFIALTLLLSFAIYQLRRFSNYDKQISQMLSVQGNADMLWGDFAKGTIISKGDFPIFKKYGVKYEEYREFVDIESFRDDLRKIDSLGLPFYQRAIEIKTPDMESAVHIRRFTHKTGDNSFMSYFLDITAEKYREAELGKLADTDHLTTLLNRRAIDRILSEKSASIIVNPKKIYAFMFDIDNFKNVNDSYGHDIGDKTLIAAAGCIKSVFGYGSAGRWGGEEFLAIAELDSDDEAIRMAEEVLSALSKCKITVGARTSFCVTISCGASEMLADETYAEVITRADNGLYQAKNDGKNCVRFIGHDSADMSLTRYRRGGELPFSYDSNVALRYNRIMSQIVRAIFYGSNTGSVINELLKIATVYNNLSRAYFYEKLDDEYLTLTYIYASADSDSKDRMPANIPLPENDGQNEFFTPRFISDTSRADKLNELDMLTPDIKAYARLPVVINNVFTGLICFDNCCEAHEWTSDERLILADLAVIWSEVLSRRDLEHRLDISNTSLFSILDSIDEYIYVVENKTYKLLFSNKRLRDDFNLGLDYNNKICWQVLWPGTDAPCPFCPHKNMTDENGRLIAGHSIRGEYYNDHIGSFASGWYDVTSTVIDWEIGEKAVLMYVRNVTDQKRFEERRQLLLDESKIQELKATLALEGANSFSWESMPSKDMLILSRTAEATLGYPLSHTEGKLSKYMELIPAEYRVNLQKRQLDYLNSDTDMYMSEYPLVTADGDMKWFLSKGRCANPEDGVIYGVCVDVTESKKNERRLAELAYRDSLTGLYNMQYILDSLVKSPREDFKNFGAMLLDICSFKNVNEAFGFDYGNKILADIAGRLADMFVDKLIIRPSGDHFLIIFENTSIRELEDRATETLNAFSEPILIDGQQIGIHLKIGIALRSEMDVIKLLKDSEIALYDAKSDSGGDYCVLNDEIRLAFKKRVNTELELRKGVEQRKGLENHEFVMYYQPKIMAGSKKLVGAEALIRWVHPEYGIISPADFIPIAEETGLIIPIGEFVIREVTRQLGEWAGRGFDIFLSLNLSFKQFLSPHLRGNILNAMSDNNIQLGKLIIEITESTMISDFSSIKEFLNELRSIGIGISLDDFGTGYSSINYLSKMPLDCLKIDKSFVDNAATNDTDKTLLKTIITMSHNLNFTVTAEGVETDEQLSMLEDMDCDIIQGFLYSRPLPADEFEKFMRSWGK